MDTKFVFPATTSRVRWNRMCEKAGLYPIHSLPEKIKTLKEIYKMSDTDVKAFSVSAIPPIPYLKNSYKEILSYVAARNPKEEFDLVWHHIDRDLNRKESRQRWLGMCKLVGLQPSDSMEKKITVLKKVFNIDDIPPAASQLDKSPGETAISANSSSTGVPVKRAAKYARNHFYMNDRLTAISGRLDELREELDMLRQQRQTPDLSRVSFDTQIERDASTNREHGGHVKSTDHDDDEIRQSKIELKKKRKHHKLAVDLEESLIPDKEEDKYKKQIKKKKNKCREDDIAEAGERKAKKVKKKHRHSQFS